MKSNYSFNAELISNKKFTNSQMEKIKNGIESNEIFSRFCSFFLDCTEVNFNGYLEIYLENISFDIDLTIEIENMVAELDSIISGGWSNDSKIEFYCEHPVINSIWYKDGKEWKNLVSNSPKSNEGFSSQPWEDVNDDEFYGGFLDYNKDYEDDENW